MLVDISTCPAECVSLSVRVCGCSGSREAHGASAAVLKEQLVGMLHPIKTVTDAGTF